MCMLLPNLLQSLALLLFPRFSLFSWSFASPTIFCSYCLRLLISEPYLFSSPPPPPPRRPAHSARNVPVASVCCILRSILS